MAGLTTAWHPAPPRTGVPRGTRVELRRLVEENAAVVWKGAVEVRREPMSHGYLSVAACPVDVPGTVTVECTTWSAGFVQHDRCELTCVEVRPDEIRLGPVTLYADPVGIVDGLPENPQTLSYFFSPESVAALHEFEGAYVTSVNKRLYGHLTVEPAELRPLMEWRRDGRAVGIGFRAGFLSSGEEDIGAHEVSVGPPASARRAALTTYRARVTSPATFPVVPGLEKIEFGVATEPPGFEGLVTWVASTKFGATVPPLGAGSTFESRFEDTWGPHPNGGAWQWLGVCADNARLEADLKTGPCCAGTVYAGTMPVPPPLAEYPRIASTVGACADLPGVPVGVTDVYVDAPVDPASPYVPFVDYRACAGGSGVVFNADRAGIYIVEVEVPGANPRFALHVDTGLQEAGVINDADAAEKPRRTPERQFYAIPTPDGDVVLVEEPEEDDPTLDCAFEILQDAGHAPQRFSTPLDAIQKIEQAYSDNGDRPVTVVLDTHGAPGKVTMGKGLQKEKDVGPLLIGRTGQMSTTLFVCRLKGKVSCVQFMGCEVAFSTPGPFGDGDSFLQELANCLSVPGEPPVMVKAYNRAVAVGDDGFSVVIDGPGDTAANHLVTKTGDASQPCVYINRCVYKIASFSTNTCTGAPGTDGCPADGGCPFYVGQQAMNTTHVCSMPGDCTRPTGTPKSCDGGICTPVWMTDYCAECP